MAEGACAVEVVEIEGEGEEEACVMGERLRLAVREERGSFLSGGEGCSCGGRDAVPGSGRLWVSVYE